MLVVGETLVDLVQVALGVGQLPLGVDQSALAGFEIGLPLRQLLRELRIGAGERGQLVLQRLETSGRRHEFLIEMALTIRCNFELSLGLGAPDLTRCPLFSGLLLGLFRSRQHLSRGADRRFARIDAALDISSSDR